MRRALSGFAVSMALAGSVLAGSFSDGLERYVAGKSSTESIKVLLSLKEQAKVADLDQQLRDRKASLAERHELVITELMSTATRTQTDLLNELAALKTAGKVNGFTPYWITNAVVVNAPISVLRQLAARGDIDLAEVDLVVDAVLPVIPAKGLVIEQDNGNRVITAGLAAINADDVWSLLGVNGAGALVGSIDTGVDGTHPALSTRWRGNNGHPVSECWLDASGLGHATPQDGHGHGTHTTGTMVGGSDVGVAPGAMWIASNVIAGGTGSVFDNAVIASFQFMADPDGNPATLDDVPDVVQNSWGVNEGFSGYVDCDSRWWAAIDNCEASGVCVTFSAGNEGPGASTLRSPGDRCVTPYSCFSVGATDPVNGNVIASFSSRGPSTCSPAPYPIKPEVSAPGVDTYSTYPGGGFTTMSGTSMAGPHVAGVVALMRSANPNVDVNTIKQILMDTAGGVEDNTYGHGHIDAYAAVLAVMEGYGTLAGTVTSSSSGLPIEGASVSNTAGPQISSTNASGAYSMMMAEGPYAMQYSAFGYVAQNQAVNIVADVTTTQNVALSPAPSAVLSGFVYDADNNPVSGATIDFTNVILPNATTNAGGFYSTSIPVGFTYNVTAFKLGVGSQSQTVTFNAAQTLDFHLPIYEGFESGNFAAFNWTQGGNAPWTIVSNVVYEGTYAAKSGLITAGQTSTMNMGMAVPSPGTITFRYKVSSESSFDYLRFYIDGVQQDAWSGEIDWTQATYPVAVGNHTFTWTYSKDGSVDTGSDCAWVDEIIPPDAVYPNVEVNPLSLSETVSPGGTASDIVNVSNTGEGDLLWTASVSTFSAASTVPYLELAKGQADPRQGEAARLSGGPDAFGYSWKDSNEPGGPAFSWFDISGIGTVVGNTDDTNYGPFNLGFTFNYYGVNYSTVRVCTNGWLSFTSTSNTLSPQGIPNVADPNALLAGMIRDLNPGAGGSLMYYADGANSRFIVQWTGVPFYGTWDYQTFQMIIHSDGRIVYQYLTVVNATDCSVGIENETGTDGLQVAFNTAYLTNNLAIEFATTTPWLSVTPSSGTVVSSGSGSFSVGYNATDIVFGTFTGQVNFSCNDADTPSITIPVTMIVSGVDNTAPIITHTALGNTENTVGPYAVNANVADPSGLQSVTLAYRINGGAWTNVAMTGGPTYTANLAGRPIGTVIDYTITAVDASPAHNTAVTAINSFTILPPAGLEYCQNFEVGTLDDWTSVNLGAGNEWGPSTYGVQGYTAYIQYGSSTQEDHAALVSPVFDCSGPVTVQLDFWQYLRMGYAGYWSDAYVRGSTDGGATWTQLIAEWHSTDGGGTEFILEGLYNYDLTSWAAGQSNVKIMFEFIDLYDWYWHVDDICITGTLPANPDPVVLSIAYAGSLANLSWTAVSGATSYDVYSAPAMDGTYTLLANTTGLSYSVPVTTGTTVFQVVTRNDAAAVATVNSNPLARPVTETERARFTK